MHPHLFVVRLGEVERPLGTFGLFLALGVLVAGGLAIRAAARDRQDVGKAFAVLALTVLGCFVGAWVTFGLVEWARTGTLAALSGGGGMVFFGAIPGGALGLFVAARALSFPALRVLELALPGLAAGHALGRFGCLLGGCCFGRPSDLPWAILYTHPAAPAAHERVLRHPSPLYEALCLLALAFALALVPPRSPGSGQRAAIYLAVYCVLRALVEGTRGDAIRGLWLGGLASTSQLLALAGLSLAALILARRRSHHV